MEGLHSPFGIINQYIISGRFTLKQVLYEINFPMLIMLDADSAKYVSGDKKEKVIQITSEEQLKNLIDKKYGK